MNSGSIETPWVVAEEDRARTVELARELEGDVEDPPAVSGVQFIPGPVLCGEAIGH